MDSAEHKCGKDLPGLRGSEIKTLAFHLRDCSSSFSLHSEQNELKMSVKITLWGCQLTVIIGADTVIGKQGECWGLALREKLQEDLLLRCFLYLRLSD